MKKLLVLALLFAFAVSAVAMEAPEEKSPYTERIEALVKQYNDLVAKEIQIQDAKKEILGRVKELQFQQEESKKEEPNKEEKKGWFGK